MRQWIRSHLTYANVMATIAVFIALGGGTTAVALSGSNTVQSDDLGPGAQVKAADVADNAVNGADVVDNGLTGADVQGLGGADVTDNSLRGADVNESTLGKVPSAANADTVGGQGPAAFQATGSDGWTALTLTPGNDPTNFCHWVNNGGSTPDASYYRDRDGTVHLRGVVHAVDGALFSCGDASPGSDEFITVSGLPVGYRPEFQMAFTTSANKKPGQVRVAPHLNSGIGPNGSISIEPGYPTYADAKVGVSLDGISFRCFPSGQNGCP